MDPKKLLGQEVAKLVKNSEVLGLGTGSTADEAIKAIGERISKENLTVYGVPTSNRTETLAKGSGITIVKLGDKPITWGFDGADEIEKRTLDILKGGGGAMTREKSIAKKCRRWIVIADESKLVDRLGEFFGKIPVEVQSDQMGRVIENIYEKYQPLDVTIRQVSRHAELDSASSKEVPKHDPESSSGLKVRNDNLYLTDFGNPIIDVKVTPGTIKLEWEKDWEMLPGVVGTGLFLGGYPDEVWVGKASGKVDKITGPGRR